MNQKQYVWMLMDKAVAYYLAGSWKYKKYLALFTRAFNHAYHRHIYVPKAKRWMINQINS